MTYLFLALSVTINIIFVMYSRFLLKKLAESELFFSDASDMVAKFREHLEVVNELEMFYGDETLAALMQHSAEIIEVLEEYQANSILTEEGESDKIGELTDGS